MSQLQHLASNRSGTSAVPPAAVVHTYTNATDPVCAALFQSLRGHSLQQANDMVAGGPLQGMHILTSRILQLELRLMKWLCLKTCMPALYASTGISGTQTVSALNNTAS